MKNVDIVIPIYNAYEYTEECIKSIIKYTDLKKHTLLLIDDKSPDKNIIPMLEEYKKNNEDKNIVILKNEENRGFVKTVNKGMQYSENDVILLNSDTEVTKNWIEKMIQCAYSNEYIATVTALTNNGTIASVPNFGIDNELPKNITLEEYAEIIEKSSKKRYPEVTTGNGFCMYIKRTVIEELGLFDDVTFEKGYGEENDFCYRALDYGYINVICDDTFIYHKGTQSFKKENLTKSRAEIVESHMKKLIKKYPIYTTKTDNFLALNPIRDIGENVLINTLLYNKKRMLFLINEWQENMEMTAGTSLHLKDIILGIKENTACFVLSPSKEDLSIYKLYLYTEDFAREIFSFKTEMNLYGQTTYTNNSYKEMIECILDTFKIDIMHVHHFLFHSFDAIDAAKQRNIESIITLHDLYMICPTINMIYKDKYCELHKEKNCLNCLNYRYGLESNIIENWRKTCNNVLKKFDKIIVPSENTKEQFIKIYPDLKIDVIEHGVKLIPIEKRIKESKNTFDIAFVGVMVIHKGSKILKQLIQKNNNKNIRIHLFGRADDKKVLKNNKNFIYHGPYKREELPELLVKNKIDLVCIFSICPETYSYTLTETYMANIPILTFNIGAVGDRVKKDNTGWVIPFTENVTDIINTIQKIINDKEKYNEIINNYKYYKFKTIEEMQEEYRKLYEKSKLNKQIINTDNLKNIANKSKAFEFNNYCQAYNFIIDKYEKIRNSKLFILAKKVKRKIRSKIITIKG